MAAAEAAEDADGAGIAGQETGELRVLEPMLELAEAAQDLRGVERGEEATPAGGDAVRCGGGGGVRSGGAGVCGGPPGVAGDGRGRAGDVVEAAGGADEPVVEQEDGGVAVWGCGG